MMWNVLKNVFIKNKEKDLIIQSLFQSVFRDVV